MALYKRGDVVLCKFPFEDSNEKKARPAVVLDYDSDTRTYICCKVTKTDKLYLHKGKLVKANTKLANVMKLYVDSFVDYEDRADIPEEDIIKPYGFYLDHNEISYP